MGTLPPFNFNGIINDSPLQKLESPLLTEANIHLYIKRDDLIHPCFGGNKWRKLKYNLNYAREHGFDTLLTFGGAWSNHVYATAAAGKQFGFNTIGIIRGEKQTPLNPTLSFAEKCGMQLHYVSRSQYRHRHEAGFLDETRKKFGNVYILPEGGSNELAISGCKEIVKEINNELETFDVICCACGTGSTMAGIIDAISTGKTTHTQTAIGFSALKGGEFLTTEINRFLGGKRIKPEWHIPLCLRGFGKQLHKPKFLTISEYWAIWMGLLQQ